MAWKVLEDWHFYSANSPISESLLSSPQSPRGSSIVVNACSPLSFQKVPGRLKMMHFPGVVLYEMQPFRLTLEPGGGYLRIVQTYNNCLVQKRR
mmetsp:Transcript_40733/g.73455  ORF Transcript_40733/g.73455 Transcript_40733/m.73455 type:complete len:94 (-) Transcript_40733:1160-1441(-)